MSFGLYDIASEPQDENHHWISENGCEIEAFTWIQSKGMENNSLFLPFIVLTIL